VRSVHAGPAAGLLAQLALLGVLGATVRLGPLAWLVGITCAGVITVSLDRGLVARRAGPLGPADWVTLGRATLSVAVAALVAQSFAAPVPAALVVVLSAVALVLDGVDGFVARRTGTATALGARFDMEIDAFLILVLSVFVGAQVGWWVMAIGLARYAFVIAGWILPWMRGGLPPRPWRKVVAATQGIVLTAAAAGVLPGWLVTAALLVALALLAESFGRDVWWLWAHRRTSVIAADTGAGFRSGLLTTAAGLLVWFALVVPNDLSAMTPAAFLRIPLEGLIIVGLLALLNPAPRQAAAALVGLLLGFLIIVKVLDMGFYVAFGRPFNPMIDWTYFGSAVGLLSLSVGRREAIVSLIGAGLLIVVVLMIMPLALMRLVTVADHHRGGALRVVGALGIAWVVFALLGVQAVPGVPVASASAAAIAVDNVDQVRAGIADEQRFADAAAVDPMRDVPADRLLAALRGKDVIIAFVESYGRVALEGSAFSPTVSAVLDDGSKQLAEAGFGSRSGFLTSSTFGGLSWLAHGTLQSGLWIDNQARYDHLVATDRTTLSSSFKRAGWRTVAVVPSNEVDWPEGRTFYGYDAIYDERNMGYLGLKFGYASMPDQYILSTLQRTELAKADHPPVMAEVDLVSSHAPWTPLPRLIDWKDVGNGTVFDSMAVQGPGAQDLWRDRDNVKAAYGRSIEYTLSTLISFVRTYGTDRTVLVVLGDHQPGTMVSGQGGGHDVPISIVARDPAVLQRVSGWAWQDGLRPAPNAPVWRMDQFRDRFLTAFDAP